MVRCDRIQALRKARSPALPGNADSLALPRSPSTESDVQNVSLPLFGAENQLEHHQLFLTNVLEDNALLVLL